MQKFTQGLHLSGRLDDIVRVASFERFLQNYKLNSMPIDQLTSFESLFANIGRKLDADPELKQLLSHVLALMIEERCNMGPDIIPVHEESYDVAEIQPQAIEPESNAVSELTSPPVSPEDLASLVKAFMPSLAHKNASSVSLRTGGPATLETIKARLKIKQEAIGLAVERAEANLRGEKVQPAGQWFYNVISKAKTMPNCYL